MLIGGAIAAALLPSAAEPGDKAGHVTWPVVAAAIALVVVPVLVFMPSGDFSAGKIALSLLIAALITVGYGFVRLPESCPRLLLAADLLPIALIVLVVIDVSGYLPHSPTLSNAPDSGDLVLSAQQHLDFFLGPANDVLHGRALLVDTASQYGVGSIYALAAWFEPLRSATGR